MTNDDDAALDEEILARLLSDDLIAIVARAPGRARVLGAPDDDQLADDVRALAAALARAHVVGERTPSLSSSSSLLARAGARALDVARGVRGPLADGGLYAIVDVTPASDVERVARRARAVAEGGARLVQVRAKGLTDRAWLAAARVVLDALAPLEVPLLVNDRPDVARAAGAAGVHVGTDDLPLAACRDILGDEAIIGRSGHTLDDVREGLLGRPSYLAFGPVFASTTKSGHAPVTGLSALGEAARLSSVPLVAIGGITTPLHAALCVLAGARLVSAISAFSSTEPPRVAALRFSVAIAFARELAHA